MLMRPALALSPPRRWKTRSAGTPARTRHQPRNPVGWILIFFVVLLLICLDAGYYAVLRLLVGVDRDDVLGAALTLRPLYDAQITSRTRSRCELHGLVLYRPLVYSAAIITTTA
jgi:hypothetical protein